MKNIKLILIILFIALPYMIRAEKKALLVGIANYPEESKWGKINADNDIGIITPGLMKQGFHKENITALLNEKATKSGIMNAFNALIKNANPGDVIFFLFAGHGQQVTDISGDEIDDWDESMVPYDGPICNTTGEKWASKHFIDDELNTLISKLRKKLGSSGDILVCIDACHSGTISRGNEDDTFRGTKKRYIISGYKNKTEDIKKKNLYTEQVHNKDEQNMSPFVIISACGAEQENKEHNDRMTGKKYGVLSYTISSLFSKDISNMSYTSFFESIKTEMSSLNIHYALRQSPQLEGYAKRKVFAGKAVSIPNHFTITRYSTLTKTIVINGGLLMGIKPGAIIDFYAPDSYYIHRAKSIQSGTVINAGLTESILKLSTSKDIDPKSWAIVSKYTFPKEREREEKARIIREAKSPIKGVTFEISPIDKNGNVISLDKKRRNNNIEFSHNDEFDIILTNTSQDPHYFQIINILPDNGIKLLKMGGTKYDYYIESGESKTITLNIDEGTPTGLETIIVVSSKTVLDLSPLETFGSDTTRGNSNNYNPLDNTQYTRYKFQDVSLDSKSYYVKNK